MKDAAKPKTTWFSVPDCNLGTLLERIEKLNRRCRKMGIPVIEVEAEVGYTAHRYKSTYSPGKQWVAECEVEEFAARHKAWVDTGSRMDWHDVAVRGVAPKYDGWKFIATLEPLPADGETYNLIMNVPGEVCPTHYMKPEHVGTCDHCRARRNRKQTFVCRHDDGRTVAVGRSCIKDFLGHTDPNHLASWAEIMCGLGELGGAAEDEMWLGGGGRVDPRYDLEFFLGWVTGVTRQHGWVSRTKAREEERWATVDRVNNLLDPPSFTGRNAASERAKWQEDKDECNPTDDDKATATKALEWALELDIDKLLNDSGESYLANVAAVARAGVVGPRTWGLGGSICAAYARAEEQKRKNAERPESRHRGELKKREDYRVRVDRVVPMEGHYGTTWITGMAAWCEERGDYCDDLTWFATTGHDMEVGGEYVIKATVKEHGEWNGRPQTTVNRVKVLEDINMENDLPVVAGVC